MYFVEKPLCRPNHCAVTPFIHQDDEGFIDTRSELPGFDNHVYVSVKSLREMIRFMKWPTPEDYQGLVDEAEGLQRKVVDLEAQLREVDRELDAVEVLKRAPKWSEAKRAGRPPKKATADV